MSVLLLEAAWPRLRSKCAGAVRPVEPPKRPSRRPLAETLFYSVVVGAFKRCFPLFLTRRGPRYSAPSRSNAKHIRDERSRRRGAASDSFRLGVSPQGARNGNRKGCGASDQGSIAQFAASSMCLGVVLAGKDARIPSHFRCRCATSEASHFTFRRDHLRLRLPTLRSSAAWTTLMSKFRAVGYPQWRS